MGNLAALVPVALFLAFAVGLSVVVRHRTQSASDGGGFVKEYFIGNRGLGGFVLAMTTIATYGSVSSFVGGPGQAWSIGFGWVYMAVVQVTALVLLYGIVGKKMALIARKLDAITVADVIRARYGSNALANLSAAIVVVFFGATMIAQFVGGAKLFEAVTGYSYVFGLVLFGVAVILFTTIGGFRGVALTDALCGIAIIGPVAASISTVSSLLISSSSALVKDVWMHYAEARGRRMGERALSVSSQAVTLGLGAVVFVLAVVPPDVIWKINMFAFGGLETAFFWVMVCGLFWRRANRTGALWSMAGGMLAYCATMALGFKVADLHQIVIGIVVAGVCMVAGSLAGKQAPASRMEVFFPDCDSGAEAANGSSARRAG